jgi:hypothetical protein
MACVGWGGWLTWESGVPRCSGEYLTIVKAARQRLPNRLTLRRFPFDEPDPLCSSNLSSRALYGAPRPDCKSKAVIGVPDGTDSTEEDDAAQDR